MAAPYVTARRRPRRRAPGWRGSRVTPFEVLEHTADVGVRATGPTLEACFEDATRGLAAIMGIDAPGAGQDVRIDLEGRDLGGLLVDWLDEVLYLHETRDAALAGVRVERVTPERVQGLVALAPRGAEPAEGTQVKAVTLHQLDVRRTPSGYAAQVFFDV